MRVTKRSLGLAALAAISIGRLGVSSIAAVASDLTNTYLKNATYVSAIIKDQERIYKFDVEIDARYCCQGANISYGNTYQLRVTSTWDDAQKLATERLELGKDALGLNYACHSDPWLMPSTPCTYKAYFFAADHILTKVANSYAKDGPISRKWFPKALPDNLRPTPEILAPTGEPVSMDNLKAGLDLVIRLPRWFVEYAADRTGTYQVKASGGGYPSTTAKYQFLVQNDVGKFLVPYTFFAGGGPGNYNVSVEVEAGASQSKPTYKGFEVRPGIPRAVAGPDPSPRAGTGPRIPAPPQRLTTGREQPQQQNAESIQARSAAQVFVNPTWKGVRVDWCLNWGQNCGEPAATEFCKKSSYSKATAWARASGVGPTVVVGDNKPCLPKTCDGFASVTCAR